MHFHRKHMELVDAVNNETDDRLRREADVYLSGWLDGLADCGRDRGLMLIEADTEQMNRGHDIPMCGGIFLNPQERHKPDDTEQALDSQ